MTIRRKVVVHGRVQGVFFRETCRRKARESGLGGWVANRPDGAVEVHVEGPPDAVHDVIEWCRDGPPSAEVESVDVSDEDPAGEATFEVR